MKALLLLLLISFPAFASKEVGNGADGVLRNGKVYLLDFVQDGIEESPYFNAAVPMNPKLSEHLQQLLPNFPEVILPLARKLSELEQLSPAVAWALAEALRLHSIELVEGILPEIHDNESILDRRTKNYVQVAIRKERAILLAGKWWALMEANQKAALLLHEVIYAFQRLRITPKLTETGLKEILAQESSVVRAVVRFLFTEKRIKEGLPLFLEVAKAENSLEGLANAFPGKVKSVSSSQDFSRITTSDPDDEFVIEFKCSKQGLTYSAAELRIGCP